MSRLTRWLRERRNLAAGAGSSDPFIAQSRLLAGREKPVIIDAGAHHGETALAYLNRLPDARLFCFEPFPDSFIKLKTALAGQPAAESVQLALAEVPGRSVFRVNQLEATSSLLERPNGDRQYFPAGGHTIDSIEVELTSVDAFCAERGLTRLNALKMDIQGAELNALEGARTMLEAGRIDLIFTETMFVAHYEGGPLYHELAAFLEGFGYRLFNLFQLLNAPDGQLRYGNALFISPEHRERALK